MYYDWREPGALEELARLGFTDENSVHLSLGNFNLLAQSIKEEDDNYERIDDYLKGRHAVPKSAEDDEHIMALRANSIVNLIPLAVEAVVDVMKVEGYRRDSGSGVTDDLEPNEEWRQWKRNRMDYKLPIALRAARCYGESYFVVEQDGKKNVNVSVLPTKRTTAFFTDPVNDLRPAILMTIDRWPSVSGDGKVDIPGRARAWDSSLKFDLAFDDESKFSMVSPPVKHGFAGCPSVRLPNMLDDNGHVESVVNSLIIPNDRVNQATFNSLTIGDFAAFKVKWGSGIETGAKLDANGNPMVNADGTAVPADVPVSSRRMLTTPNDSAKFGSIDETDIRPSILHEEQAIKNFAIKACLPPHALLTPSMANLGVEALNSVEASFWRRVGGWQTLVSEVLEDLFRLIAEGLGDHAGMESFEGEVQWADMREKSFAQTMDGLAKAVAMVGAPSDWAISRIPGVSAYDRRRIAAMKDEEHTKMVNDFSAAGELARAENAQQTAKPVAPTESTNIPFAQAQF